MQTFRPDIEGLRTIAVALVIFYHYQFPWITGGFVGVDVFFVISGFVITRMLQNKLATGNFSFADFYTRRVLRLVPVFLLVSTVTFLCISPFYFDDDYYIFSKSWMAALIGLSNFYFFAELSQYFSPEAGTIPLLHTWSLAVEEQFYFFWPAAFLALATLAPRLRLALFAVAWLAALALSVYLAHHHANAAYYLLPARIFELTLGAGVALFGAHAWRLRPWLAESLTLAGLTLILATALLLRSTSTFPGLNALWPTLGTALIIYAGMHRTTLVSRALSIQPLVFLGGISYSLYLWHWPPVALLNYQLIEIDWPIRLAMLAAIVPLSWLSYRFVENRFRYRRWSLKKTLGIFILIPLIAIWAAQVTIRTSDDISFRIPEERRELYKIISQQNPADLFKRCFKGRPYEFEQSGACIFGNRDAAQPDSMLIGDSHAMALLGFVEELIADTDLSMLVVTRASTPFLLEEDMRALDPDPTKAQRSAALQRYLEQRPMTVFVGAWWNAYLTKPGMHEAFLRSIEWLLQQGHAVVMLEGVPELPSDMFAHCLLKNMDSCEIDAGPVRERMAAFLALKQEMTQRWPELVWLQPAQVLCDATQCQTELDGLPLYRDDSHLNYLGAREIGRRYLFLPQLNPGTRASGNPPSPHHR